MICINEGVPKGEKGTHLSGQVIGHIDPDQRSRTHMPGITYPAKSLTPVRAGPLPASKAVCREKTPHCVYLNLSLPGAPTIQL